MPSDFGSTPDGQAVHRLTLGAEPGVVVHLITLGAAIQGLEVTGGDGVRRDVTLGYADLDAYLAEQDYLGAVVGRYANRIAGGRVEIDGREATLPVNDRGQHLHGGPDGWHLRVWEVAAHDHRSATLTLHSPDGDQGYPGAVDVAARYEVDGDTVRLTLTATADATTLAAPTSHLYLNLDGAGTSIDDHVLQVPAAAYTPIDESAIPTGELAPVDGTPFDLRAPQRLGDVVRRPHPQVDSVGGVDHNLVVDGDGMRPVAVLSSPATRTRVTIRSDQPGLQVYTGNGLDGTTTSAHGHPIEHRGGIALEPQVFPDSPHHEGEPGWPTAVLRPGETYRAEIGWEFSALS